MAQYMIEFNGVKHIIGAQNASVARTTFMRLMEAEGVVKLYKIEIESSKGSVNITQAKRNKTAKLVVPKGNGKLSIEDLLSRRDGSCREYIGSKKDYYRKELVKNEETAP